MLRDILFTILPYLAAASPTPQAWSPPPLSATPNQITVLNSCRYIVHISSVQGSYPAQSVPPPPNNTIISAGNTYSENLIIHCASDTKTEEVRCAGQTLKISRTDDFGDGKITQVEWTNNQESKTWYNLSFVNCVINGNDASGCPGHDAGLQIVAGRNCTKFSCAPNEHCDQQIYYLPEHGGKPNAPNSMCPMTEGVAVELCVDLRNTGN